MEQQEEKKINCQKKNELLGYIQRECLVPDSRNPGEFIRPKPENGSDKLKFLAPSSWVFHEDITRKVLDGNYEAITPFSAEFVTTLNCTNRCVGPCSYCLQRMNEGIPDRNNGRNPRVHMQSLEFAEGLMDKLIDGGIKGVIFTGGGEPSLFRGLEELMGYTSRKRIDMVLYTNGNSWTPERISQVADTSPLVVRLSLNCGTKEGYNKFHRPFNPESAFERVKRSIGCFAKEARKNPKMDFGVSFIMNEVNYKEIPETARVLRGIIENTGGKISFAAYRPAFNYNGCKQTSPKILDESYELVERDVRQILQGTGINVQNIKCRYDALKGEERGYEICRATGLFAELGPSGELHSCCDRNCFKVYTIGDLTKKSLREIYAGKLRSVVMDYANDYQCSTCPTACKPHEVNKQFEKIEKLRAKGEMYKVEAWIEAYHDAPKPKMVNF